MAEKPTYEELVKRVKELEHEKLQSNLIKTTLIKSDEWLSDKMDFNPIPEISPLDVDLESIISVEEIQSIMDDFCYLTNLVTAVLDLKGKVIVATGWQDMCTKFHRINPQTANNCTESDLFLAKNLKPGEYVSYKCKNGLWDVVTPLYVGTKHLGNVFTGQFFYDDDKIDEDFFIKQAEKYGFEKESYLNAFRDIPIYNKNTIDHLMKFLIKFTTYISKISLSNIQLEKEIKNRTKAEKALKESETHLRSLIDSLPDLVWLKNSDGIYLSCNSKFEQFFGAKESVIVGKTDYDFVDTDLADFFRANDRKAMAAGRPSMNEEWLTFVENGYKGLFETIKSPICDADGNLIGVLGIARDISERKNAENGLRESEKRYKSAQRMGHVGHWEYDLVTKFFWGSDEANRIYGFDPESKNFTTDEIENCIPDRGRVHQALVDLIEKNKPYDLEIEIHPVSGPKQKFVKSIAELQKDSSGKPYKVTGVIQDITRQKEEELEKQQLELNLLQAQKMESIGTLAGGIAHDFNNILGIIIGNTELALDDVPKYNSAHSNLEEIKKASLRAKNIVKQLLSFSRKTDQKLQPIQIAIIIKDALKFLRSTIPSTINIHQDIQTTEEMIFADPTQINQIIMNLCINASHAMAQTGGDLTVTVEKVNLDYQLFKDYPGLKSGDHVKIMVSDTGPGIDPEIIDQIFDPYFTTKGVGKGSGMGLAVVHGFVKNHNGTIRVDSSQGKGTKFSILFPVTSEKPVAETQTDKNIPRGNETLLFVDDEISITKMVQRMFERLGYKVETATTPQDALELFRSKPDHFDLVITDMTMPQMTGVTLSEKLMDIRKDIPIIICTGHSTLVDEEKAKELGLAAYVMKPINMLETAQTIRKVLDRKQSPVQG